MTDFEERLMRMKVPDSERDPFEDQLGMALMMQFDRRTTGLKKQLRLAWSLAVLLAVLLSVAVVRPDLLSRVDDSGNRFKAARGPYIAETDRFEPNQGGVIQCLPVVNPVEAKLIPAEGYKPQRTVVIQQYKSRRREVITIVSEYNDKTRIVTRRLAEQ